jgi:hypothetical protein
MMGGEVELEGGDKTVNVVDVEGGAKTPCKSWQKRKKSTGRCINVKSRMSKSMRMRMRGGEVLEGGQTLQGGSTQAVPNAAVPEPVISGGSVVVPQIAPYEPVSTETVLEGGKRYTRTTYMMGGNSASNTAPVDLQGGENAETVEGGGKKKKCKRGKTRQGTGVCHKPKSRSRSRKSRSRKM